MERLTELFENIFIQIPYLKTFIPKIGMTDIIEMLILVFVFYKILKTIKNTRAWVFLQGMMILLFAYTASEMLQLHVIKAIFEGLFGTALVLVIIVFQQEIRKMIAELGSKGKGIFNRTRKKDKYKKRISDEAIEEIIEAVKDMSAVKTGALILIQKDIPLKEYSDTGIYVNADISSQMLVQIFEKNTPLHDGAVVINNGRIESATCYLPLSNSSDISKDLGTRHRAGIGVSEVSDTLVIIVSEETGKISTVKGGQISHGITPEKLREELRAIQNTEIEITPKMDFWKNGKLKFMAAVGTVVLWTVLMNNINPMQSVLIQDVPVTLLNTRAITDEGMSYHVTSGSTVDVEVSGRRSVVDTITKEDLAAYADMSKLSITNAAEIRVNCKVNGVTAESKETMMAIAVEDTKELDYDIKVKTVGEVASGNYINAITPEHKSLKIKGPVTMVNVIGDVVAEYDISSAKDGDVLITDIVIYDKNGMVMDTKDLQLGFETVSATVSMYETKTVPLTVSVMGISDDGEITSYTYDKNDIIIAADELTLEATKGIFMEVPVNIDSSVDSSEFVKVVNMADFLPKNVFLAEKENKLAINVSYEKYVEKNVDVKIEMINKSRKLEYSAESLSVRVRGTKEDIDTLEITGIIDVNGLEAGVYPVDVFIDNVNVIPGEYKTNVSIEEVSH